LNLSDVSYGYIQEVNKLFLAGFSPIVTFAQKIIFTMVSNFAKAFVKTLEEYGEYQNVAESAVTLIADCAAMELVSVISEARHLLRLRCGRRLTTSDVTRILRNRGAQPINFFGNGTYLPARIAGKDGLYVDLDEELELSTFLKDYNSRPPLESRLFAYWLFNENEETEETRADLMLAEKKVEIEQQQNVLEERRQQRLECVYPMLCRPNSISKEMQMYFFTMTEACVCHDEERRKLALTSLANDTSLKCLLPHFISFIHRGVLVNALGSSFVICIHLMRMVEAILKNPSFNCDWYLHRLLPSMLNCALYTRLSTKPEAMEHWKLRDFSAKNIAKVVSKNKHLRTRVEKFLGRVINDSHSSFHNIYGAVATLVELGVEEIERTLLPSLNAIAQKLRSTDPTMTVMDKYGQRKLGESLIVTLRNYIHERRLPLATLWQFQDKFGSYIGTIVFNGSYHRGSVVSPPISTSWRHKAPFKSSSSSSFSAAANSFTVGRTILANSDKPPQLTPAVSTPPSFVFRRN
ncbi:Transcription initiation factor TFIID subunit 6, partial [Trichinella pseudospiralis]